MDDKELSGTVLVGALPNPKEGVQDRNEFVLVGGEQGELVKAFSAPHEESSHGFDNRETRVADGSRCGVCV